jgi:hypothetical protein
MKFHSCGTNSTRRELANLRDEIGSIGREFRRFEAIEQAVGVERDPDAWLNPHERTRKQGVKIMPSEHSNIA